MAYAPEYLRTSIRSNTPPAIPPLIWNFFDVKINAGIDAFPFSNIYYVADTSIFIAADIPFYNERTAWSDVLISPRRVASPTALTKWPDASANALAAYDLSIDEHDFISPTIALPNTILSIAAFLTNRGCVFVNSAPPSIVSGIRLVFWALIVVKVANALMGIL